MQEACQDLALAYVWTGESIFADRLIAHIRAWFLNMDTRMNPHFVYSSVDVEAEVKEGRQYVRDWSPVHRLLILRPCYALLLCWCVCV
jgi:hypothetical protein